MEKAIRYSGNKPFKHVNLDLDAFGILVKWKYGFRVKSYSDAIRLVDRLLREHCKDHN